MWIPPDEILNEGNDEEKIQMAISEPMDEEEDDEDEDDEDEDLADEGAAKSLKKVLPLAPHKQNKKAFKVKSGKRSLDSATKLHSKKLKK